MATVCLACDPTHPGDMVVRTDPRGYTTAYAYDPLDRPISATDPLGDTTAYAYDQVGQ